MYTTNANISEPLEDRPKLHAVRLMLAAWEVRAGLADLGSVSDSMTRHRRPQLLDDMQYKLTSFLGRSATVSMTGMNDEAGPKDVHEIRHRTPNYRSQVREQSSRPRATSIGVFGEIDRLDRLVCSQFRTVMSKLNFVIL